MKEKEGRKERKEREGGRRKKEREKEERRVRGREGEMEGGKKGEREGGNKGSSIPWYTAQMSATVPGSPTWVARTQINQLLLLPPKALTESWNWNELLEDANGPKWHKIHRYEIKRETEECSKQKASSCHCSFNASRCKTLLL